MDEKKNSDVFNVKLNQKKNNSKSDGSAASMFRGIFSERWIKFLLVFVLGSLFFVLLQLLGRQLGSLIVIFLPLIFGYWLALILEPLIVFFNRFFSKNFSRFFAAFITTILILFLVIGLIVVFLVLLNNILINLVNSSAANREIIKDITSKINEIDSLKIVKTTDESYTLTASTSQEWTLQGKVGGLYILFFYIVQAVSSLKFIVLNLIKTLNSTSEEGYFSIFLKNFSFIFSILYIFFFSLLFMFFAVFKKPRAFFSWIWKYLTKNLDEETRFELNISLKNNLKNWSKGLFIDQAYVLAGTGFFIFLTGMIFRNNSNLVKPSYIFVLTIFMFLANFVPYIGPWIGAFFIGGIALVDVVQTDPQQLYNWAPFILVMAGVFIVQLFELFVVTPLAYAYSIKVSPISVVLILSVVGLLFGVFLMPFALPIVIVIKTIASKVYKKEWNI